MFLRLLTRRIHVTSVVAALLFAVIGCGGGGGGVGGGSGSGAIRYTGNTAPAVLTTSNASALVTNVVGGDDSSDFLSPFGFAADDDRASTLHTHDAVRLHREFRRALEAALRALDDPTLRRGPLAVPVDDSEPCDSGSIQLKGTLADDGTGTLDVVYSDCRFGQITANGEGTVTFESVDPVLFILTAMVLSSPNLHFTGPGVDSRANFTIRLATDVRTATETATSNFVTVDQSSGRQTKAENLVEVATFNSGLSPASYSATMSGRVFDSVHGYVDIATPQALFYASREQAFPDSGQLLLSGASSARVRATTLSTTRVELALDTDGDGVFEIVATLEWSTLAGPGGDLGDDDGDDLPNGWEITNTLDPANPDDALLDNDSDGFSNLDEYLSGTDPNDASATPPSADVSVTMTDAPDPVGAGGLLVYTITVRNLGPDEARDVVLTDELPATLLFADVISGQGGCSGSTSITCNLGVLSPAQVVSVSLSVTTSVEGIETNSATVSSSNVDPNPGNDSAMATTTVGGLVGDSGEVRVNLAWGSSTDLDLAVVDPCGNRIDFTTPVATCQGFVGTLDEDANAGVINPVNPAENIVWPDGAPSGQYVVFVDYFSSPEPQPPPTPFTVRTFSGSTSNTFTGTLNDGELVEVTRFTF